MSVPDDGLRLSDDPAIASLLESGHSPMVLFRIRRRDCGCFLASVVRVDRTDVMAIGTRSLVYVTTEKAQARKQAYMVLLDAPGQPVVAGCKHQAGHVVDLVQVRGHRDAVATGAMRPGTAFVVD